MGVAAAAAGKRGGDARAERDGRTAAAAGSDAAGSGSRTGAAEEQQRRSSSRGAEEQLRSSAEELSISRGAAEEEQPWEAPASCTPSVSNKEGQQQHRRTACASGCLMLAALELEIKRRGSDCHWGGAEDAPLTSVARRSRFASVRACTRPSCFEDYCQCDWLVSQARPVTD
jgi:hypothetical protein